MNDKVVLITGGARGIGNTVAKFLAKEGATVWITSRQAQQPHLISKISSGEIGEVRLDVTDEKNVQAVFERMDTLYGKLDVLINNAGISVFKPIEETTLKEWDDAFLTNMSGLFLCSKEAFKLMKGRGGRIINIGSVSGYIPIKENGAYGASKYAVRGFSKICNEEWKEQNVRVSIINAGAVYTGMWNEREGFNPSDMLQPEDIAEAVVDIVRKPIHVRIDEIKILPSKGVL
ncbi:SDR family oxidoreductase [Brevibacillus choshinensis]|nr:SDR family oxidoreductase [Brevibacillus choshinensis]